MIIFLSIILLLKKAYSEAELVAGCARNDRRAQEALYRRFFPAMVQMCRRYAKDEDTALDMINNGFLKVFKKIHTFGAKGSLEGWIRRIVYRSIADYYREHSKYLHFLVLDDYDHSIPDQEVQPCYEADILKAIQALPAISRDVFTLYAIEGYAHAEIATLLNMSEGTSKWHLSTARQRLRALLAEKTHPLVVVNNTILLEK